MQTPDLVTTAQASEILGLDRFVFLRLVKRGDVAPVARGAGKRGALWFKAAEIQALRKARERAA